ncbi:MAG: multidrug effflux MFS transporter [Deinococcales bacterium]
MRTARFAILLGGLGALGPFSIDTYFPSFSTMARHFDVAPADVQLTLSLYLMTMAVMTLVHGPLSDAFGRKTVLVTALGLYTVTSLVCTVAASFAWLLAARAAQGLVGGAGMIVGRAIVRDLFKGPQAQRLMAQMTMVVALAPAAAPVIGGYLHAALGWRAPFAFLAVLGATLAIATSALLPETLSRGDRQPLRPASLGRAYVRVALDPAFLALASALALGFGGFLVYVSSAADFVPQVLGLGETQYGWLFLPIVAGLVAGAWAASRSADVVRPRSVVTLGLAIMGVGAAWNVALNLCQVPAVPWLVLPLPVYTFGLALQAPAVTLFALDLYPARRGLAASVQGFVQTLVFALIASVLAPRLFGSGPAYSTAMLVLLLGAAAGWLVFLRSRGGETVRHGTP